MSDNILLVTKDGVSFVLPLEQAKQSTTITQLMEDVLNVSDGHQIPIAVSSDMMKWVVTYLQTPEDQLEWANVDIETMYPIIMTASYLAIPNMLKFVIQNVADRIKGKNPEEMREILHLEKAMTDEEEAAFRAEHADWLN